MSHSPEDESSLQSNTVANRKEGMFFAITGKAENRDLHVFSYRPAKHTNLSRKIQ